MKLITCRQQVASRYISPVAATSTTAASTGRENRGEAGGDHLARMEHADFELLPIVPERIENCRRVSPLCALCGARAVLQQALIVTPVKVVGAHVDVWVLVPIVLQETHTENHEGGKGKAEPYGQTDTPAMHLIERSEVSRVKV